MPRSARSAPTSPCAEHRPRPSTESRWRGVSRSPLASLSASRCRPFRGPSRIRTARAACAEHPRAMIRGGLLHRPSRDVETMLFLPFLSSPAPLGSNPVCRRITIADRGKCPPTKGRFTTFDSHDGLEPSLQLNESNLSPRPCGEFLHSLGTAERAPNRTRNHGPDHPRVISVAPPLHSSAVAASDCCSTALTRPAAAASTTSGSA